MNRAVILVLAAWPLWGCAGDRWADQPAAGAVPEPAYAFDVGGSKRLFVEAVALDRDGRAQAAIGKTREAIRLFPLDPRPYRLMLDAAAKSGDAAALRFARFFHARLPSIERYGPWIAAQHFRTAADADRAEAIEDAEIRDNARRISAYLSAMVCDADRRRATTDRERLDFFRRYGVEGMVNRMRLWLEDLPDECPRVTVK